MAIMNCPKCDTLIDLDTNLEDWDEDNNQCWECTEREKNEQ